MPSAETTEGDGAVRGVRGLRRPADGRAIRCRALGEQSRRAVGMAAGRVGWRTPKREGVAAVGMHISPHDLERRCRIYCRPIYTGLGQITVRPIGPLDADLAQAFVTGLSGTSRYFRF